MIINQLIEKIIIVDQLITKNILNSPHPFLFNQFFDFFSITGWWFFVWGLIFFYLFFIEEKKHKEFIFFFFLSIILSSFLTNVVLKNLFQRPRPYHKNSSFRLITSKSNHSNFNQIQPVSTNFNQFPPLSTNYPSDYSFPSGHATLSFSAATILSFFDKKRRKIFYLIAALIAFSRVYLGYHYFFDIVAGSLIGWFLSKIVLKMSKIVLITNH